MRGGGLTAWRHPSGRSDEAYVSKHFDTKYTLRHEPLWLSSLGQTLDRSIAFLLSEAGRGDAEKISQGTARQQELQLEGNQSFDLPFPTTSA